MSRSRTPPEDLQRGLISRGERVLLRNYRQQPIVIAFGHGVEVWDVNRNRYLDMTAGIAVCCLGHAHPALRRALSDQANRLLHTSNLYYNEQQILAAEAIVERCFADRVFFCNSGAEANEAALKLARRYQHVVAGRPERNVIVAAEDSFHGRTIATTALTGQEKYRVGFGPLFEPVRFVPFGDVDAAREALSARDACAMIVEPIQAEGGVVVPQRGYLSALREIADETGTLLIFDEVQTGVGRTGKWFDHQHEDVEPDVMTLAKALGGGVPIGAIAVSERAAAGLGYVEGAAVPHASTFGGNPLACAAAAAVIQTIDDEGLLENCVQAGDYLGSRLRGLVKDFEIAREARGRGLLRGVAVAKNAAGIVGKCRERGVLLSVAGPNVIRFAPPLIVRKKHVDEAVDVLAEVLSGTT
jgi:predicted acetylornithine/succinylornithine family transaminase